MLVYVPSSGTCCSIEASMKTGTFMVVLMANSAKLTLRFTVLLNKTDKILAPVNTSYQRVLINSVTVHFEKKYAQFQIKFYKMRISLLSNVLIN